MISFSMSASMSLLGTLGPIGRSENDQSQQDLSCGGVSLSIG